MSETAGRGVRANRVREQAAVGRVGSGEIVVEPPALDDGAGLGKEKASGLAALPERRCWRSCPPRDDGHDRFAVKRPKKRLICGQARLPGVSVSQVAWRYDVNANLVFTWLRDLRFADGEVASFHPVQIVGPLELAAPPSPGKGLTEIDLAGGHRLRIIGSYDPEALARLLRGLLAYDPDPGRHAGVAGGTGRGDAAAEPVHRASFRVLWWSPRRPGEGDLVGWPRRLPVREAAGARPLRLAGGGRVPLTPTQLSMLLEGIDWRTPQRTWQPEAAG